MTRALTIGPGVTIDAGGNAITNGSLSGNASTATALQTGRTIDGQTFDGTGNITVIAPGTHAATGKTTPADADEMPLVDSAASNVLKKLTWANAKATLKTYFDTLYPTVTTPAIVLGSSAAAGSAATTIRSDGTIAAFDATNPTTQAYGDAAAVGTAAFAARRDHKHAMPAALFPGVYLKTGTYWYSPNGTISTQTLTVSTLYVFPVWLQAGVVIDRIGIVVVSNTANSTFNPAIYADNGSFQPGARLIDGGSLDTHTSAGNKEASISWTVPSAGVYWFGGAPQTAVATMSCYANVSVIGGMPFLPYGSGSTYPGGNFMCGYSVGSVTGTPPDPFGTPVVTNVVPRINFRVA